MRTREHHFHATKDIFDFWQTKVGFGIIVPFDPDTELGDRVVVGSYESAPAITGWIREYMHNYTPDACFTETRVFCTDLAGIEAHEELYERLRRKA